MGIELADLVVNPIGSQLLSGLNLPHWKIIESKLYTGELPSLDSGIVQLPQSADFLNQF